MVNEKKVAIVGCGFVGSSSAFALMQSGLFSEMVLIDVDKNRAEGEALDIAHGMTFAEPMKIYAGDYSDVADAAMIVVTAGAAQKPGETRLDLVNKNVSIFKSIIPEIKKSGFDGISANRLQPGRCSDLRRHQDVRPARGPRHRFRHRARHRPPAADAWCPRRG